MSDALLKYLTDLQQSVALEASTEGNERSLVEAFATLTLDVLGDAGELDSPIVAPYESRGARATGFEISDDGDVLHLVLADYHALPEIRTLTKVELTSHFKRMLAFVGRSSDGLWREIEESSPGWEMAKTISDLWKDIAEVRLTLITSALLKTDVPATTEFEGRTVHHGVWDIDRLYKLESSGRAQEPITVDVKEFWPDPIPCLGPHGEAGSYEAYLATLPGPFLASVYETYGPRLLELNVRSFLQSRGKVNRGIQETIANEPARFLAYNNGVSMTASRVDVEMTPQGPAITRIHDLQIVNGGQTTASLHHAKIKNKADLSGIWVQAKLSVVQPEQLSDLVPLISQFANSQNRVNMADFTANDPFHIAVEQLSRSVWAPSGGGSQMTRWFYERARGQYADAHARERTPAKQREFKKLHPTAQKFTKTDVAKYEATWDQHPWQVSLGAEKNFREFMLALEKRGQFAPDQKYFDNLIAKAILFKRAEKIIGGLQLGGYRAQTVTYTLARISHATGQRLDLGRIWREQGLTDALEAAIADLGSITHAALVSSAGSRNVSEWAKKEACWKQLLEVEWSVPDALAKELVVAGQRTTTRTTTSVDEQLTDAEAVAMEQVSKVPAETWFALSNWAKETQNLQSWQRSIAFSLGRLAAGGRSPSRKQAVQGKKILDESHRLGFAV